MIPVFFAVFPVEQPTIEAAELWRVEDPDAPGAVSRSLYGATLPAHPADGVPTRPEPIGVPDVFGVASEGITGMNADRWHANGITGDGVKVAVFDSGFWAADLDISHLGDFNTADCYAHVGCGVPIDVFTPTDPGLLGQHGLACAEALHAVAPDAELTLVRANTLTAIENAVDWAIREEIDVVSMSMSFFNSSFYDGTGPFAEPMDRLAAGGVLMVKSAGNYADQHWLGEWEDGDNDGRMDGDGDNGLWVNLPADGGASVNWNRHGSCTSLDLDAYFVAPDGQIVARAEKRQTADPDDCEAVERPSGVPTAGWYRLEVVHRRGLTTALKVDIQLRGGTFDEPVFEGSIVDPGAHPQVFTVGAVKGAGYRDNPIESFSSWGPANNGLPKPEIAGPDGLSTAVYGSEGFFGTSASTPAVAGAIALVMSEDPSLTPFQAAERLRAQAWGGRDDGGSDPRWGAGKARLWVQEDAEALCGRRPLVMGAFLLPLAWARRRRRQPPSR